MVEVAAAVLALLVQLEILLKEATVVLVFNRQSMELQLIELGAAVVAHTQRER
jgi:hypothetical protein